MAVIFSLRKYESKMKIKLRILATFITCCILIAGCTQEKHYIKKVEDARNAKIGITTGSTMEISAKKIFPNAKIESFDDIMDAVMALKSDKLDAVITSYLSCFNVVKMNPELKFLPEKLDNEITAVAVNKGNQELLRSVDVIIGELKADGTISEMVKRWFKSDLTPYVEKKISVPDKGKVLKIGVCATREPLNYIDKNGKVNGFDAELAKHIAARLNRPVEFFNMKFSALIPALKSGKIDLIISGMSSTEERKKYIDFTQPYFLNSQVLLVKDHETQQVSSLKLKSADDLKDKKIGVLLGSVYDTYAQEHFPGATILQYKSQADEILAVKKGKIDASIYTQETLYEVMQSNNDLAFLGDPLLSIPIGMGFNQNDREYREKFNEFLSEIRKNGIYDDMYRRWITNHESSMPEIKHTNTNGNFSVGIVSDTGLPFVAVRNNKLAGFDIELLERFAAYLGKDIKYQDLDFGSLIASVATNKIDMIGSPLMITPERKKKIAFSDPYYDLHGSVFALKKNIAVYGANESGEQSHPVAKFFSDLKESFNSNIIQENRWELIVDGLKITIIISVLATIFGSLLGGVVCAMRMSPSSILKNTASLYITILRGTPVLVLLMLIFYVLFASVNIDPVIVSVIAFGMNFAAYVAEIYRTGIQSIDKGQTEAGIAMGFSRYKTFLFIILPQTIQRILPVYKGEFISLVKMTSIVGYIAVQDLTKASDIIRSRTFDAFFPIVMVAVLYFLISRLLMLSMEYLERLTDRKVRTKQLSEK